MNVITLALRKGGAGKSTLTAHLAACAWSNGYRCLLLDADPQGSLTLSHSQRADRGPALQSGARGIERALAFAAPAKREDREAPVLMQSREALDREGVPVWSGQISQRATFSLSLAAGASVCEAAPDSAAAAEICALWSAVVRSVDVVNAAHAVARIRAA